MGDTAPAMLDRLRLPARSLAGTWTAMGNSWGADPTSLPNARRPSIPSRTTKVLVPARAGRDAVPRTTPCPGRRWSFKRLAVVALTVTEGDRLTALLQSTTTLRPPRRTASGRCEGNLGRHRGGILSRVVVAADAVLTPASRAA